MRFTYDRTADAILILLAEAKVEKTKEIAPGVYADYDSEGRLIAVEALKASEKYDLNGVEAEGLVTYTPPHVPGEDVDRKEAAAGPTAAERKALADKFIETVERYSRDMGPRTWTRDDQYDRPKRYYQ